MLSQEIYASWNAKTVDDLAVLLDNVQGPNVPLEKSGSQFKKAVLHKIERRRVVELRKTDYVAEPGEKRGCCRRCCCCCCCCCQKKSAKVKSIECKTLQVFENLCVAATASFSRAISSIKALIQQLSYWDSVKPGMDGLSVIGGDLWLLSFACQHLIDSPNEEFSMQAHLADIRGTYQELGQAGEMFLEIAQVFNTDVLVLRSDALTVFKKLLKKWAFLKEANPLLIRPEDGIKHIAHPRRRLGGGLESPEDLDEDDDVFSVKWSPLTVTIQLTEKDHPKAFGKMHPQDRLTIFRKFMKATLDKVEMAAEDLSLVSQQISEVEVVDLHKLSGKQIILSMVAFSKGSDVPKEFLAGEKERLVIILNEFWYSVDVLNENVYILMRLVQETRDIIRTCYVYADIFYKWHMPSYDAFISKQRRSRHSVKDVLFRMTPKPRLKKLSDERSIISLMDFSSSIYQGVAQDIPMRFDGMFLQLRSNDLDWVDEPQGLVSGIVDKRKSTASVITKTKSSKIKK